MQKQLIHSFFQNIKQSSFKVKYWDGEEKDYGAGNPDFKVIFHKPFDKSFDLSEPMLSFCKAYMDDVIDFEGNFDEVMKLTNINNDLFKRKHRNLFKATSKLLNRFNIRKKQKENIHQHYDIGNDFFSLWLDETLSYSCGYFKDKTNTIKEAQINKIDHVLKKLQLKSGEKLLDIGSGWGWLIIRAAKKYGVKATGITISKEQYKETVERIERLGLTDQVEVKLMDYLDLDKKDSQFDKIVSVGMFEHVGRENLQRYLEKVQDLLVHGGLFLLHSIMNEFEQAGNSWIKKYIFPGGYVPSLRETVSFLPECGFQLLHAESLRIHYAMTIDRWHDNFMAQWDTIEKKYGRRFTRMWELYLKGCSSNFRVSGLNIYQLLLSKGLNNDLPLTLEHIYN